MHARKLFGAIILCLIATLAQAAGLRTIDIAADAGGPALGGAVWSPCSQPAGEVNLGKLSLRGLKDCPLPDKRLPLIVMSHGRTGTFAGHHDIAEVLADAGFIVAAINHAWPDTGSDLSRTDDLSIYVHAAKRHQAPDRFHARCPKLCSEHRPRTYRPLTGSRAAAIPPSR